MGFVNNYIILTDSDNIPVVSSLFIQLSISNCNPQTSAHCNGDGTNRLYDIQSM
jgi:hypothetical protein